MKLSIPPVLKPGTLDQSMQHQWPGNARELENIVERALIDHQINAMDESLTFDSLLTGLPKNPIDFHGPPSEDIRPLYEVISSHIKKALVHTHGKVGGKNGTASLLGVHPNTLRVRMKKLGIHFGRS